MILIESSKLFNVNICLPSYSYNVSLQLLPFIEKIRKCLLYLIYFQPFHMKSQMYLPPRCLHEWWHWLGRPLLAASVEVLGVPGAVWPQDGLLRHAAPLLGHDQPRPRGGGRGSRGGRGEGGALYSLPSLLLLLSVLQEVVQPRQSLVLTGHGGVLGVVVRVGGRGVI